MVHVTIVKVGEVNTTRECFDAEVIIRSRWREPQLDHTGQVPYITLSAAPTVWNSLATDITNSCSLTVFKSKLKTYIFRQTFNRSN